MAMLNRLGRLVWEAGGLPTLMDLFEDGSVDRQLVASVIRTSGEEGESLLLKLMRLHKNDKIRMATASVLSYRLPVNERDLEADLLLMDEYETDPSTMRPG
eukprot:CAMPEP_0116873004 /NCGR_PEP_ID=MMETSP0463-20121206/3960_1 /TAXON_ID=181622 /ORGANISM="Strombidinopsis sp, Strain SopsisLIS2011" /LENGTH=100 /DNA_ID=CAMNT_0004514203 /DNA_START=1450 /DNA_END=1752 /DNA_ORIENTATION=+